jgi:hypothetical protein
MKVGDTLGTRIALTTIYLARLHFWAKITMLRLCWIGPSVLKLNECREKSVVLGFSWVRASP